VKNERGRPLERPRHDHTDVDDTTGVGEGLAGVRAPAPVWWTAADQAEVDLIKFELVTALAKHWAEHEGCCSEHGLCAGAKKAIAIAQAHVDRMGLRSRAIWLREEQDTIDEGDAAA
jgi:hypothetical protein